MKVSREGSEVLLKQESTPSMDLYLDHSSKQNTGLQTDSSLALQGVIYERTHTGFYLACSKWQVYMR